MSLTPLNTIYVPQWIDPSLLIWYDTCVTLDVSNEPCGCELFSIASLSPSLRYPPRLGCCTNAPPSWTCVRLPSHGQPRPFCPPPVLPAADHAGLPFWSRSAHSKLSERGLKCSIITRSIAFSPAFKKILKKPPCPLVIVALYLVLNIMLCTTKPAFCWQ